MADPVKYRRVDIGFQGGSVISLRVQQDNYTALRQAMGGSERWHELESEDAAVTLDLSQIIYVRLDTERDRVGF
jgi:hypothetical protein